LAIQQSLRIQPATMSRRTPQEIRDAFLRVMQELRSVLKTEHVPEKLLVIMVGYSHTSSTGYLRAKAYFRKKRITL
jgi:hypothetical protein